MRMRVSLLLTVALLCACASRDPARGGEPPTIATLAQRQVEIAPDPGIDGSTEKTIAAYRDFLAADPGSSRRPQALRRLGDLEMDLADERSASSPAPAPDYQAAVTRYRQVLQAYPADPDNDRVLYQLARAHEQAGQLEQALAALDRLVAEHPRTGYRAEAQFRRGELLFGLRQHARAEAAYGDVLAQADTAYRERALFMRGWSVYKQGRPEEALESFFGVLDLKVAGREGYTLEEVKGLTRADRELVEDTFRVVSLGLASMQGAQTIPRYIVTGERRTYEFRVHQQLAELYLKQERVKDAADTLAAFAGAHPLDAQAPRMLSRVIEIYASHGFDALALASKQAYVQRYGAGSELRRTNPSVWEAAQPLVRTHLAELARHHHAAAQKSREHADRQEALRWYHRVLEDFPADADAPAHRFLLAELLYEDGQFAQAAVEYEKVAYPAASGPPAHPRRAEAGYAALLAHAGQATLRSAAAPAAIDERAIESALRFADTFPADPRTPTVLTDVADRLFAGQQADRAVAVAQRILSLQPAAGARERQVAGTVLAHAAFEAGRFADAELQYRDVLALAAGAQAAPAVQAALVERLAASVYKQAEQARDAGRSRDALDHFARVAAVAPQSALHATAQYDAAAALIGMKDWAAAARALEDLRQRFPNHPLAAQAPPKLALAYLEQQRWGLAAVEFERIAAAAKEPEVARDALYQAASLHGKAGAQAAAARTWEKYAGLYPEPVAAALDARIELAKIARAQGRLERERALLTEAVELEAAAGAARNDYTRTLGASAALALAEPASEAFRKVALTEPLSRSLKAKKSRLEDALRAYAKVTEYGIADTTTAATFHTASLYQDFGRALLQSERPKQLKKAEREQYDVMLEEQAFPFEEKAIELHETNAGRAAEGHWSAWVERSFAALAVLRPVRYGKVEREQPGAGESAALNGRAIALRRQGRFDDARRFYEEAIAAAPADGVPLLNLAILNDLYLGDRRRALECYERYQALVSPPDTTVSKWVADLKIRAPAPNLLSRKDGR